MNRGKNRICPVERAGGFDNKVRRWLQNPQKILRPYITENMTVLDLGCGPGFFSIDIARMVGKFGRVIAADLQEGMLQKLSKKIRGTELENRITLHKTEENKIGLSERIDFALAFYVVHEIPNQRKLFMELESILRPCGKVLFVEPSFRVSKSAFAECIEKARNAGFDICEGPKMLFSKTAILTKSGKDIGADRFRSGTTSHSV
jgi:ubiquinone/menaquinone biosynthesis C-methylase UbiE